MNREKINVVFERIYRENLHDMYKVALYYTLHEQAAVEITQKAFYNLYLHIEEVNLETVRAYLGRTIRNMTYNWTRDNKIAKEGNIEEIFTGNLLCVRQGKSGFDSIEDEDIDVIRKYLKPVFDLDGQLIIRKEM